SACDGRSEAECDGMTPACGGPALAGDVADRMRGDDACGPTPRAAVCHLEEPCGDASRKPMHFVVCESESLVCSGQHELYPRQGLLRVVVPRGGIAGEQSP